MTKHIRERLGRDSLMISASYLLPAALGFFTIPIYYEQFSAVSFNFLTICWAALGYFGFFDLGVGKTMTILVGRRRQIEKPTQHRVSQMWIANGFIWTLVVGVGGTSIVSLGAAVYFSGLDESALGLLTILFFGLSIFLGILNSYLRGVVEGGNNFLATSVNRGIVGTLILGLPLVVLDADPSTLEFKFVLLMFIAKISGIIQIIFPLVGMDLGLIRWRTQKFIFKIGMWFGISNFVGPLMVSGDRFLLVLILPAPELAKYLFIQEILLRFLIVPTAISGALLPKLSKRETALRAQLPKIAMLTAFLTTLILMAFFVFVMLLGNIFPAYKVFVEISTVFYLFVIGIIFNSIGQIIIVELQVNLKQKQIALAHCVQVVLFFCLIYAVVPIWGIIGAALCWSLRAILDTLWLSHLYWKKVWRWKI